MSIGLDQFDMNKIQGIEKAIQAGQTPVPEQRELYDRYVAVRMQRHIEQTSDPDYGKRGGSF